ncbi:MAG: polysaccharide deacetylase family protein [Clostridiaceae bacterium]|nr:polysaccharide deacetylase family protein [Clostridiaceae bacterium]
MIYSFKTETPVICLTLDDGGDKKSVERALKILKQNNVKCIFFVIGKYLKLYPDLWRSAFEDGHQICNHTQNHKWLSELNNDEIRKEISQWEDSAKAVLGEKYVKKMKREFPYLRLPGSAGSKSKRVLGVVQEMGYTVIGWDVETYYAILRHYNLQTEPSEPIAQKVSEHVIKRAKSGSIILLHFNPYDTLKLEDTINGFFKKGLEIRLLSDINYQDTYDKGTSSNIPFYHELF